MNGVVASTRKLENDVKRYKFFVSFVHLALHEPFCCLIENDLFPFDPE